MPVEEWSSDAFIEGARSWVAEVCAASGKRLTCEWEQPQCRAWSSAIRFETDRGRVWFKVNGSGTAHEAQLVEALGRLRPGLAPEMLGRDPERHWSLTADAGPTLRSVATPDDLWAQWEEILTSYAAAQIELANHLGALLATGLPHRGPTELPGLLRDTHARLAALPPSRGGLSSGQAAALLALFPRFDEWCRDLAESRIPDSIQHDDLHSNNITWSGTMATSRIIDWGDASIGAPFATLLATINSISFHARLPGNGATWADPRIQRLRDAYLEPFTTFAAPSELRRLVDLARRTGCVAKAASWGAALAEASPTERAAENWPIRGWLLDLLEPWA